MKRLYYILPVVVFLLLAIFLALSLRKSPPDVLRSVLIGKPAPATNLPPLDPGQPGVTSADLTTPGRVTIVNFYASWCIPCREEAPQLEQLARARGVRLIGIAYKDKPEDARAFLAQYGNPFARTAMDLSGRAGIDWGLTGVPETFVIDSRGIVRGHFGPLTADGLMFDVLPTIWRASQ